MVRLEVHGNVPEELTMRCLCLSLLWLLPGVCPGQIPGPLGSAIAVKQGNAEFEELVARYTVLQEEFYADQPRSGDDRQKRFLELHPVNTMVGDFLALERQSRGSRIGFSCLYHLVVSGVSTPDANSPVTKGKVAALQILGRHYRDHPDIDLTFRNLFRGARIVESKKFLRDLIRASPHSHVRANAMFELANHLALEANLPAICEAHLAVIDPADPETLLQRDYFARMIESLHDVSVDQNRAEARALVERIRREHPNALVTPRANVRTPVLVEVKRGEYDSILKAHRDRLVDRLPSVHFELHHSIGQQAPQIGGDDATGKPMRLADFHGKVVVVMFSFKGCGPCEAMYPDNRRLLEELTGEPFAFVGVHRDESIDTVHEALRSGVVTWRVWWDGRDKRISRRWNIRGWPSTFVLDQRGVIRFRDLRGKELANAVRHLLNQETESSQSHR